MSIMKYDLNGKEVDINSAKLRDVDKSDFDKAYIYRMWYVDGNQMTHKEIDLFEYKYDGIAKQLAKGELCNT